MKGYANNAGAGSSVSSPSLLYWPSSLSQWAFVGILLVQAIAVLALEGWALSVFESGLSQEAYDPLFRPSLDPILDQNGNPLMFPPGFVPYTRSLPVFLALYIFGLIYELGLAWDALRLKNTIQIIGLGIFNILLLIYGALQQVQIKDSLFVLKPVLDPNVEKQTLEKKLSNVIIAVPVIIAFFSVGLLYLSWKLYHEFAWTIYKHVSADLKLRRRYMIFEIYIALLKFDFFFFLAFSIEFLVLLAANDQDAEFYLTIIAVPVTIIILIGAAVIVRRELKALMWLVLLFYVIGFAYFLFKLIRIWAPSNHKQIYAPAQKPLTVFAVATIILIVITFFVAFKCLRNFDRGLKPFVNKRGKTPVGHEDDKMYMHDMPNPNHPSSGASMPDHRMVIE